MPLGGGIIIKKKTLTTSNLIRTVSTISESITPEGICYAQSIIASELVA
jgi:hypothetical protein